MTDPGFRKADLEVLRQWAIDGIKEAESAYCAGHPVWIKHHRHMKDVLRLIDRVAEFEEWSDGVSFQGTKVIWDEVDD